MANILETISASVNTHPTLYAAAGAGLVGLVAINKYFSGGICKIRRDLSGQVVVITGANTGIGKETARVLAEQKATLVLACRDFNRTKPILDELQTKYSKDKCHFIALDLSDLDSVRSFAKEFNSKFDRLDILLNNAGIMMLPQRQTTKQGFEKQLGTNHLGHFLLTGLLLEKLKKTPESRVVNVSSLVHKMGLKEPIMYFDDLQLEQKYDGSVSYSQSKLANILFTRELQKRFDQKGINCKSVCLHPGVVRTELTRNVLDNPIKRGIYSVIEPAYSIFSKSPFEGAQTNIYCCQEKFINLKGGAYYADCKEDSTSKQSKIEEHWQKLFNISEKLVGHKFEF